MIALHAESRVRSHRAPVPSQFRCEAVSLVLKKIVFVAMCHQALTKTNRNNRNNLNNNSNSIKPQNQLPVSNLNEYSPISTIIINQNPTNTQAKTNKKQQKCTPQ
jgi:hypothetical protein